MSAAYIVDAVRTPRGRGRPDGGLYTLSPIDLGATVLRALLERTGIDPAIVDDCVFGCAETVNDQGSNIARSSWLHAQLPDTVPGMVVSRFCGSGLDAVNVAAAKVMAGQADAVVAGGVEMLSLVPMLGTGGPTGSDAWFNQASSLTPQGVAADLIATVNGITRADADTFAVESQSKANRAIAEGRLAESIVPVHDFNGNLVLDADEHPRAGTTVETLAGLKPAFADAGVRGGFDDLLRRRYPELLHVDHVHHAGNSSGIVDGAAALLIVSEETLARHALTPKARISAFAQAGVDPAIMLIGPDDACRRCLARAQLGYDDIDLFEVNEAFAAVVLDFMKRSGVDGDKINVSGGAIAYGHPIGATGAMLVGTLVDDLARTGVRRGMVSMCVGLGMAVATLVENAR